MSIQENGMDSGGRSEDYSLSFIKYALNYSIKSGESNFIRGRFVVVLQELMNMGLKQVTLKSLQPNGLCKITALDPTDPQKVLPELTIFDSSTDTLFLS